MPRKPSLERTLRSLEERLLEPEIRRSTAEVEALLTDDFVEFASDGRAYAKSRIVAALRVEPPKRYVLTDFCVRSLTPDVALVTFRLDKHLPGKKKPVASLRSSIWKYADGRWRMTFHQGTLSAKDRSPANPD